MYDSAKFIKETNTINMEDIAMNSLLVLDGECLSHIAKIVGDNDNADLVLEKSKNLKKKIDENLWDEKNELYANKHWDKGFVCPSPTSFYPLAAGVPEGERVDKLIDHIFNEEEFWTEMPMPSIWLKEESVNDNVYWRGRSWPPLNFITYVGLKRYGKFKEATKLLNQIMKHYTRLWDEEKACYENHNTFTGEGSDSVDTDPFYGWGALYPLMWTLEHIDIDPWNGFHFGNPEGEDFEINGFKMADGVYTLNCSKEGTVLVKNGAEIVKTDAVGRFTHFECSDHYIAVVVPVQENDCTIALGTGKPIKVLINGVESELSNTVAVKKGKSIKIEIYK
jgi:putative isomerase